VSLGNYIESYEKKMRGQESDFVRITIKGLAALAEEHGVDSVQYKTAEQILKEFLQQVNGGTSRESLQRLSQIRGGGEY